MDVEDEIAAGLGDVVGRPGNGQAQGTAIPFERQARDCPDCSGDPHPTWNSLRNNFAASTIALNFPTATSRGRYFMPQSGARITRSLAT